nr:MAG TPA: hypothetical protein [Caudoviricetes sp.]
MVLVICKKVSYSVISIIRLIFILIIERRKYKTCL